jgi:DNA repair protein RadC
VQTDNSELLSENVARSVSRRNKPDIPPFEQAGYVEWNSSTKALVLFLAAIGAADPGRIARTLLDEFGTLSDILAASSWRLRRVVGKRLARTIRSSHGLMKAMLRERIVDGPVVHRSQELVDLLQAKIGFLKQECLFALFVDSKGRLMRIERISDGCFNEVQIDQRSIIGCALAIGATGFVLVHNHPSGIPKPSNSDIASTERLKRLAAELDLHLLDHLIIARGKLGSIQDFWREARWSEGS